MARRLLALVALLIACDEDATPGDPNQGNTTPCTNGCEAEQRRYQDCLDVACDAPYRTCFGPDYRTGVYNGGPCSAYYTCLDRCGCNDGSCQLSCGQLPITCQECLAGQLQACMYEAQCTQPQCPTQDAGIGNAGACNRLLGCCSQLTGAEQTQCSTLHQSLAPLGDDTCQGLLQTFCR